MFPAYRQWLKALPHHRFSIDTRGNVRETLWRRNDCILFNIIGIAPCADAPPLLPEVIHLCRGSRRDEDRRRRGELPACHEWRPSYWSHVTITTISPRRPVVFVSPQCRPDVRLCCPFFSFQTLTRESLGVLMAEWRRQPKIVKTLQ